MHCMYDIKIALNVRYRINKSFRLVYVPKHWNPTNNHIPLRSILKLSSRLLLVLPSGIFLSGITRYRLRSSFMRHFVHRLVYPSPQVVYSAHQTCSKCSHFALFLLERKSRFSVPPPPQKSIGMYVSRNVVLLRNHCWGGNATMPSLYCWTACHFQQYKVKVPYVCAEVVKELNTVKCM